MFLLQFMAGAEKQLLGVGPHHNARPNLETQDRIVMFILTVLSQVS